MKKFLFALLAFSFAFAACQKEESSPTVSFETAIPVTADGTSTLTLNVTGYTGTEPLTIPVTFTTDAVEGTDYEVSAKEFVYGGNTPVTTITVTSLKFGTGKEITATLVPGKCKAGRYMTTTFPLSEKLGYISFDSKTSFLTQTVDVQVTVYDKDGKMKTLEKGDKIAVSVDATSTAVEGTHFAFDGEKAVSIDAGAGTGSVKLNIIGDEAVAGQDKIVLKLDLGEKYSIGQNASATITIIGSAFNKLDGKWVINELVTDKKYMDNTWYLEGAEAQLGKFPEFNAEDAITIDLAKGLFTPYFKSGFKNYFKGESAIVKDKEIILREMSSKTNLQMILLDNINRYFSDSVASEDKTALVAMRTINVNEQELLDLYIIDYEPKDFLSVLYDYECIKADIRPTCATGGPNTLMSGAFINLTFKKAE